MTGGSRADGVQLVGRRRAVKLSDLVGFGLSVSRIIHAIRVYLECFLDVFWMMITMFHVSQITDTSHAMTFGRYSTFLCCIVFTDGREHVVRVSVLVVCGAVL